MSRIIKLFLRVALAASFLSAVADRFGWWGKSAVWGNWNSFVDYTKTINPWLPAASIPIVAGMATVAEVLFGIALLLGYRTSLVAKLSGCLLLAFALAMTFSTGIKGPLDYSVFSASAAAFGLSQIKEKYLEID